MEPYRNKVWRQLVELCDRAVQSNEIVIANAEAIDPLENVAMPVTHEGRTVGALLLRLHESFDQADRRLLSAVGGQIARNLQRDEARNLDLFGLLEQFKSGVFDEPSIAVRRVLQSGQPYERELSFPERNQTLELRISLATENQGRNGNGHGFANGSGKPLCFAIRVRDVTKLKEFEKMKSDMVSLMSHELRTPLTSINGFAELLALDDQMPAESREFVQIISNESQRMSRMIDTFLSVTQLERGDKQEVVHIPLRLDDLAREVIAT